MSDSNFDRFNNNPAAVQNDPNYVAPDGSAPNQDSGQELITAPMFWKSALSEALSSAGLSQPSPAYSPSTYEYHKPEFQWNPADLMGFDPSTGGITSDIADDKVFLGSHRETENVPQPHIGNPRLSEEEGGPVAGDVPDTTTVGAAVNQPYLWDEDKVHDVMVKMRKSGLKVDTFEDMVGAWQMLVTRASRAFTLSHGKKEVTPWDVLSTVKKENVDAGLLDKDGNVVQTQVQKSVADISDADAWATLRTSMTAMLGRKPTDQEVTDFASTLNARAAKDPSVTTTTTTTNSDTGNSTSESNTEGGFTSNDAQRAAIDQLEGTDEFAQYQSATTYFNALNAALGEVAGGV